MLNENIVIIKFGWPVQVW